MAVTDGELPEFILAVLDALRFTGASSDRLRNLAPDEWPLLLDWCDNRQLTFLLHFRCAQALPHSVQRRIVECRDRYAQRFARLEQEVFDIADSLERQGVEFVLLKGITHAPGLTPDPILRAQGDIDLWSIGEGARRAREILVRQGYQSVSIRHSAGSARHLPPISRPNNWKWRGDLFDPEMPVSIELHHTLWSEKADCIPIPGQHGFWSRRVRRSFNGRTASVLCPQDLLAFATLHVLLHLLHGDLPMQRAWEIAHFLHEHADDAAFWKSWQQLHDPALKKVQLVVFQLVRTWFGCNLNDCLHQESAILPSEIRAWLDHFALSPLKRLRRPNKDELWLHLSLVPSLRGRLRVLSRRLIPTVFTRDRPIFRSRLKHHARAFVPKLLAGLRWYDLTRREAPLLRHAASDPRSSAIPMPHARSGESDRAATVA